MPELLLELFSEEIPARMQKKAAEDLRSLVINALVDAGLTYEGAQAHAGPRRLVLSVEGLNAKAADQVEERKGPRVDAPKPAIEGFLKSTGLKLDQLKVEDDKKGKFYVAAIRKPGRVTIEILPGIVRQVVWKFPWPKSMRWGAYGGFGEGQFGGGGFGQGAELSWVRPLRSILCTFDGELVEFKIAGIQSGNFTRGHRVMGAKKIEVRRFEDYAAKLAKNFVAVDAAARLETIRAEARNLAFAQGLELIEDEGLLHEVAGLVEWPVVLMGSFAKDFLSLPPEVIATSLKTHQKCFALREAKTGKLAGKYITVANLVAKDSGKTIIAGNNKVIAARLSDARFFWDQDRKVKLEDWAKKLDAITFHAKLGSQGERVKRIEALAGEIAKTIGADVEKAKLAARLAKADLVTGMVGEFPELQGLMGRYYALDQGIDAEVADAIRDHYKPQGPTDSTPVTKIGQAVALADKLDMLASFWLMSEKPTGSKDPFALRRAALGFIRILLEKSMKQSIKSAFATICSELAAQRPKDTGGLSSLLFQWREKLSELKELERELGDLLAFFADRLKVHLKEQGARHDLIDAVYSLGHQDDLLMIVKRVEALSKFLDTDDGKNLLAGVKRAANILKIEEKKDGRSFGSDVQISQLIKGEEKALHSAITVATGQARKAVHDEDFEGAMRAIAKLRAPVDAFFDHVTVNDKDMSFRENRLRLLNRIRAATQEVADFSKIEG